MWPANPTLSSERGGNSRPWGIPPSEPYPPTSSGRSHFLGHLFGFCFSPLRSFFSRPLSFPSAGVSHPMPTPFSLCFGLLSPPPPGIPCGRVCLLRMGWKGSAITLGTCGGLQKVQEPSHPQASAPPSHSGLRPLPMCEGEEDTSLRI